LRASTRIPLFERLLIESQSFCNRACWFCPRTYDRSGKYLDSSRQPVIERMPTEKVLGLLDEAASLGFRGPVGFHHYSEPLLDDRALTFARAAGARGMKPDLHTNGDVLQDDASLCAEVARVYDSVVVGLYDHRTDDELAEAQRFWRGRLAGTHLSFSPIGPQGTSSGHSVGVPRARVPTNPRAVIPDLTYPNAPCHRPLVRMIIQYDGEMCQCCDDTTGVFALGNVHEHSLEALWYSDRHVSTVAALVDGRRADYELCRACPMPPTGARLDGMPIDLIPRSLDRAPRGRVREVTR
jgi:radical SAM protein with 4Fe4S-binding SPASM domain